MESVNFDRAASYYDETRALPDDAASEVTAQLTAELAGRGPCLEIGVGTGRIALPLHKARVPMVGVDLSLGMMGVLVEKSGGTPPFPLAVADAAALPLRDGSVGGAIASHVFHLVADVPGTVGELLRVIRPGGVLLVAHGASTERRPTTDSDGPVARDIQARFRTEVGTVPGGFRHAAVDEEVTGLLAARGHTTRLLPTVTGSRTTTAGRVIDDLEAGRWSWTWPVPADVLARAGAATRAWATATIGPLEAPLEIVTTTTWRAYDFG